MKNLFRITAGVRDAGFTLTEVLMASAGGAMLIGVALGAMLGLMRPLRLLNLQMQADQDANMALGRMVYGVDERRGLRAAASQEVKITGSDSGWQITYNIGQAGSETNSFVWSKANGNLIFNPGKRVVGRDIVEAPKPEMDAGVISVTLTVNKSKGDLSRQRSVATAITCRNDANK